MTATMTPSAPSARLSMWRETLHETRKMFETEWKVIAIFVAAMTIINFPGWDGDPIKKLGFYMHPDFKTGLPIAVLALLRILTSVAVSYASTVAYLRKVMVQNKPQYSVAGFCSYLGQAFLVMLMSVVPLFLIGVGVGVNFVIHSQGGKTIGTYLLIAGSFSVVIWLVLFLRFCLFPPMVVLRRKPVLKNSWRTTKGSVLRILGNQLLLGLILFACIIVPMILFGILTYVVGAKSLPGQVLAGFATALYSIGSTMLFSIFFCTVYRILLREHKAASGSAKAA
jgi:hypothetical protein